MTPIKKAQAKLDELKYNFQNYDLDSFLEYVNQFTGRNISIEYLEILSPHRHGCWFTGGEIDNRDLIFLSKRVSKYTQEHTIFHELGHILFNHKTMSLSELSYFYSSPSSTEILYREPIKVTEEENKPEEIEAEAFAILVQQQLFKHGRKTDLSGIEEFIATLE